MEQFLQMAGVLAALYIAYALTLKKWDYASEAKRTERRTQLKELGLSNTFYFIHAGTLLILNAVSGGLFVLYWLFRQWKAVLTGFRRLSGQPLSGGTFMRTLGGAVTFFELNALICRTCEYMRKKIALSAVGVGHAVAGRLNRRSVGKTALLAGLLLRAVGGRACGPATPFKCLARTNLIRQTKTRGINLCRFRPSLCTGACGGIPRFYPLKTERFSRPVLKFHSSNKIIF